MNGEHPRFADRWLARMQPSFDIRETKYEISMEVPCNLSCMYPLAIADGPCPARLPGRRTNMTCNEFFGNTSALVATGNGNCSSDFLTGLLDNLRYQYKWYAGAPTWGRASYWEGRPLQACALAVYNVWIKQRETYDVQLTGLVANVSRSCTPRGASLQQQSTTSVNLTIPGAPAVVNTTLVSTIMSFINSTISAAMKAAGANTFAYAEVRATLLSATQARRLDAVDSAAMTRDMPTSSHRSLQDGAVRIGLSVVTTVNFGSALQQLDDGTNVPGAPAFSAGSFTIENVASALSLNVSALIQDAFTEGSNDTAVQDLWQTISNITGVPLSLLRFSTAAADAAPVIMQVDSTGAVPFVSSPTSSSAPAAVSRGDAGGVAEGTLAVALGVAVAGVLLAGAAALMFKHHNRVLAELGCSNITATTGQDTALVMRTVVDPTASAAAIAAGQSNDVRIAESVQAHKP